MDDERGIVRWRIRERAARRARGRERRRATWRSTCAAAPRRRSPASRLHVEVEVANFYPSIASRLAPLVLPATQSRIHVIVTHGFLRSLARLDLAESRVRRFAAPRPSTTCPTPERRGRPDAAGASLAAVALAGDRAQLRAVVARVDAAHGAGARRA